MWGIPLSQGAALGWPVTALQAVGRHLCYAMTLAILGASINLKSAVERGSFDQTMDEMDIVDPVDFTRKGIDFLVHFVHKVYDIQRIARRIRS